MSHTPRAQFVWPPKPPPGEPSLSATHAPPPAPAAPRESWWASIERAWFDPVAEPLERRASAAGWSHDAPGVFCNRCGHDIGPYESDEFGCTRCRDERLPWDRFVRLGIYAPPLSDWVCEVKFTRWRTLGLELGRLLARQIRGAGLSGDVAATIVVPVPTTLRRRLSRGIDHAGVIAQGVASELGIPLVRALHRRHRPSQRAVPLSDRVSNVARSFVCRRSAVLAGRTILLIDDVMTTGATLKAAARALRDPRRKPSPDLSACIWACTLAVTPEPGRMPVPDLKMSLTRALI